ncbi:MAG TPA: type I secretion system permease/ATPase [Candidatus Binatia bacterium]|nr:type I secretion system permease/ATPase [Candidatus Binatia bacterium]
MMVGALLANAAPEAGLRGALNACRNLLGWAILFSAGINLLYLAPSLFMMQVYDRVLNTGGMTTLLLLGLVLMFALAVLGLLDATRQRLGARLGLRLNRLLGPAVIDLGLGGGKAPESGDAARAQAGRDFDTLRQTFTSQAAYALLDAPWTLVFVLACFLIHPFVGVVTLLGGGVLLAIAVRHEQVMRPVIERSSEIAPRYYAGQEADRAAGEAVRALGMRKAMLDRQLERRHELIAAQTQTIWVQSAYGSASRFWRLALQSLVLAVGAYLAIERQITPGALIAASILAARALAPLEQVVAGWRQIEQARVAYKNLTELIDKAPVEPPRTALPAPRGDLRFERVAVRVPDASRLALANISFDLPHGQALGIVGPSGAGKSTLARVAVGALAPDGGVVRLDGANLADWDPDTRGRHVGYLPQDVSLIAGTVGENIRRFLPQSSEADALTVAAAQAAGAHDMILRLPKAYDTMLGSRGRGLSLGQAQRVALARALYGDPVLLVLDEPNAHLDADGEVALLQAINHAKARGATVLCIAHRTGVIGAMDRILVMRDGAIEHFGPRDEVLRTMAARQGGAPVTPLRARETQ